MTTRQRYTSNACDWCKSDGKRPCPQCIKSKTTCASTTSNFRFKHGRRRRRSFDFEPGQKWVDITRNGQLSYIHTTPKPGRVTEQMGEGAGDSVDSTEDGSPGLGSSRTRPSQAPGNPRRSAGSYEHLDGVAGSVATAEDDVVGDDHAEPYYGPQTASSFEQAAPTPYFPSDPPTIRSDDVALLQSLIKSPYPHPRERYSLGPLKGLPQQCNDVSRNRRAHGH